nr:PREDICTED: neuropeptide S [Opisthocomus hoazin]
MAPDCIKTCSGVSNSPLSLQSVDEYSRNAVAAAEVAWTFARLAEGLLCRLNFAFILWISMTFVCSGYPVVPSMTSNPFYLNCQLYGKSDYTEELAFLKPYLEMPLNKRSFRNGVGSGIKKTSFRRAKS